MRQDRRSMSVERPSLPLRLGRESFFAALAGTSLALLLLRARPAWTHAVIGGGDAWQNLWNLHHVDRVLRTGGSLWQTDRLWAPEGCSLYAHTLSLTNSLPGALLARATGFFAAYNALVVLAFTLAFASLYRLARRLGAGPLPAAAGAAVFASAPPLSAWRLRSPSPRVFPPSALSRARPPREPAATSPSGARRP